MAVSSLEALTVEQTCGVFMNDVGMQECKRAKSSRTKRENDRFTRCRRHGKEAKTPSGATTLQTVGRLAHIGDLPTATATADSDSNDARRNTATRP
eukprot:366336-Chlamydomonas_euryale.AAC.15